MRRWLIRIAITVALITLLTAGGVHIVLDTDIPRQLVVDVLRDETGLRVELTDLRTTWRGESSLAELRFALPDEERTVLVAESVRVRHTPLVWILLGSSVELHTIDADGGTVSLRRDDAGRWNLERVYDILPSGDGGNGPFDNLRRLDATGFTVEVEDAGGVSARVESGELHAESIGPATLRYQVTVGKGAEADGTIVLHEPWDHTAHVALQGGHPLVEPWLPDDLKPVASDVTWRGRIVDESLRGRLRIDRMDVAEYRTTGTGDVSLDGSRLSVNDVRVRVVEREAPHRWIRVDGGSVESNGADIAWDGVRATAPPGAVHMSGNYDRLRDKGRVEASWRMTSADTGVTAHGEADLTLNHSLSTTRVQGLIRAAGTAPRANFDFATQVRASGQALTSLEWGCRVTEGVAHVALVDAGEQAQRDNLQLEGLTADGRVDWPRVHIDRLRYPHRGDIRASGTFDAETLAWSADVRGRGVQLPSRYYEPPIDIDATAGGDARFVRVKEAKVTGRDFDASIFGHYDFGMGDEPPLHAKVRANWSTALPRIAASDSRAEVKVDDLPALEHGPARRPPAADEDDPAPRMVRSHFEGEVHGDLQEIDLRTVGRLTVEGLAFNNRPIDTLTLRVEANATPEQLSIQSKPFALLDGQAAFDATYKAEPALLVTNAQIDGASLSQISPFVHPQLTVTGRTSMSVTVKLPEWNVDEVIADGKFNALDVTSGGRSFRSISGELHTRRPGVVELKPITVVDAYSDGRATGRLLLDVRQGVRGRAHLRCSDWPFSVTPDIVATGLNGRVELTMDVLNRVYSGEFDVETGVRIAGHDAGTFKVSGEADRERADIRLAESALLGGRISGEATLDLRRWWRSTGTINCRDVEPMRLEPWLTGMHEVAGTMNGTLQFGPADGKHPPEPMRITAHVEPVDPITYRDVDFGAIDMRLFAGPDRLLAENIDIAAADGHIQLWASIHRTAAGWYDHLDVRWSELNLDTLYAAWDPEKAGQVPGRLAGNLALYGRLGDLTRHNGHARVRISKSDLQNTDIIGGVLALMGLKPDKPTGNGFADLRLEGRTAYVEKLIYRNRGTEVLMTARVDDLARGPSSPIDGEALGSLRPLYGINIPGLDDFDRLLRAIQANATYVTIDGTLEKPDIRQRSLENVGKTLRNLLGAGD